MKSHILPVHSRREFLQRAGGGFGALAFSYLLGLDGLSSHAESIKLDPLNPLAPRPPHHPARAKSVIWLFMEGGPSHLDLFDPKPALDKLAGKPLPPSIKRPMTAMGITAHSPLLATRRKFHKHGQSGLWVSDWYPHIAECADDLAVIRSCQADGQTHVASVCQMNTGSLLPGRPSLGAWTLYGLGSVGDNLPGFVVLAGEADDPAGGWRNWGTGFMPASFQGTRFAEGKTPILYTESPP